MRLNTNTHTNLTQRIVGFEFENIITHKDGSNINRNQIQKVWQEMQEKGWIPEQDKAKDPVISFYKTFNNKKVNIDTDCGCSLLEIGLPPLPSIHESKKLHHQIIKEILPILEKHQLILTTTGIIPGKAHLENNYRTPKDFYEMWDKHVLIHNISATIAAHQTGVSVNLNEAIQAINILTQITGLVSILTANSSISNFKILPYKDWRIAQWRFFAASTKGTLHKVTRLPQEPFTSISNYYLHFWENSECMFITPVRKNKFIQPNKKINWLEYFHGSSITGKNILGEEIKLTPSIQDLNTALLELWPFAKLHITLNEKKTEIQSFLENIKNNTLENYIKDKIDNCYIEYRIGSPAPQNEESALPALTLGLIENHKKVLEITDLLSWNEWIEFQYKAAICGFKTRHKKLNLIKTLTNLVDIAKEGLIKRNLQEEKYLDPLYERIKNKKAPADINNITLKHKTKTEFLNSVAYK